MNTQLFNVVYFQFDKTHTHHSSKFEYLKEKVLSHG